MASTRVGPRSVHGASGGGHCPSDRLLFSNINKRRSDPQKRRFRLGGVEKELGSWLGSTWFRIGPMYENKVFYKQNAWFLAWFQLVPHWSHLRRHCFLQAKCSVPGSVPVGPTYDNNFFTGKMLGSSHGSALVALATTMFFKSKMLGSWLGSS